MRPIDMTPEQIDTIDAVAESYPTTTIPVAAYHLRALCALSRVGLAAIAWRKAEHRCGASDDPDFRAAVQIADAAFRDAIRAAKEEIK